MSALKYIGGLILIVCGALCGLYFSDRTKRRLRLFEEYESFLLGCSSIIDRCTADVREIGDFCKGFPHLSAAGKAFLSAAENRSDPCIAWKESVKNMSAGYGLADKEEKLLSSFADGFGDSDSETETARLSLLRERTALYLDSLRKESEEKSRICRVVGTFVGALAAAVLI